MSPKNAIKMKKIQKSYSVHINSVDLFCPLRSNLVLFSPLNPHWPYSVLFYPRWSYSVHFVHFVLFAPLCLLWIYLVLFGPYWSYSVHFVHFGSILSTLVLFSLHWFYSVQYVHFGPIQSYSVHLIPIRSYSIHLVQFSPIGSLQFILVHLDLFLCTYIMGKDMFGLKAPNLNPKLLKKNILLIRLYACNYCCYVFVGKRHVWKKISNI